MLEDFYVDILQIFHLATLQLLIGKHHQQKEKNIQVIIIIVGILKYEKPLMSDFMQFTIEKSGDIIEFHQTLIYDILQILSWMS